MVRKTRRIIAGALVMTMLTAMFGKQNIKKEIAADEVKLSTAYTGDEILQYAKDTYDDWGYEEADTCTGFMSHVYYEDLKVPGGLEIIGHRVFVGYNRDPYNGIWTRYNPDSMLDNANRLVAEGKAILVYEGPVQGAYDSEIPVRNGDIVLTTRTEMNSAYGHVAMLEDRRDIDGTIGWYGAQGPAPTKEQEVAYQPFGKTGNEKKYDSPTGEDFPGYWQGMCHIYRVVEYAEPDIRTDVETEREIEYTLTVKKTDRKTNKPVKDNQFIFESGKIKENIKTDNQGMAEYTVKKTFRVDPAKYRYITNYDKISDSQKEELDKQNLFKSYDEANKAATEALLAQAEKEMPDFESFKITDKVSDWVYGVKNQHDNDKASKVEITVQDIKATKVSLKIVSLSDGAKCKIVDKNDNLIEEFITSDLGYGTMGYIAKNLDDNTDYKIIQTQEPYGYIKSKAMEINTSSVENNTVFLTETPIMGTLKVNVFGNTFVNFENGTANYEKSSLPDTYITVFAKEDIKMGNKIIYSKGQEVRTSTKEIDNLPVGHYYFTIIQPTLGYTSDSKQYEFTIETSDTVADPVYEKDITLNLQKQNISMKELFKEGLANRSSVIKVYSKETGSLLFKSKINDQGYLDKMSENVLPLGDYYLTVDNDNTQYEFSITGKEGNIKSYVLAIQPLNKEDVVGSIDLTLIDSLNSESYLAGSEYILSTDELFEDIISKKTTDKQGKLSFDNLELNTYYIKQNSKTGDYAINPNIYTVELTESTPSVSMILSNQRNNVLIDSKDLGGMINVEGIDLDLVDSKGNIIDSWTTSKMTHFVSGLNEGETYKVISRTKANGYNKPGEIEFVMSDGLNIVVKSKPTTDLLTNLTESQNSNLSIWVMVAILGGFTIAFATRKPFSKSNREALKWQWRK